MLRLNAFCQGDQFNFFILSFPQKKMNESNEIQSEPYSPKLDKMMNLAKEIEKLSGPIHPSKNRLHGA